MSRLILPFLLLALPLFAREAKEDTRINSLLSHIESLDGAKFIRNGSEHEAKKAADHLRMKLRKAGDRVQTAEDFINGIATKSYFTGRPYKIRFKDGSEKDSGPYLHGQLKRLDKKG